jgi:F-type H+-transporting ATPase subunit alpha
MYVGVNDYLADIPTERIHEFHTRFYEYLKTAAPDVPADIAQSKTVSDAVKAKLNDAIVEFKKRFAKAA